METIPDGWGTRLHDQADLDASMVELADSEGYYAESLRGRVRSLQLKLREASAHFQRAAQIYREAPRLADPAQIALTVAYEREHALVAGEVRPRQVPSILLACDEKLQAIQSLHRSLDALEDLQDGKADAAMATYRELLGDNVKAGTERLSLWNLGLGVAHLQLGEHGKAARRLDVAGLHACDPSCRTLGRAQIAARLTHVHGFIGDRESCRDWWRFLGAVRCPEATKVAMRRRAALLSRRSFKLGRCLLC